MARLAKPWGLYHRPRKGAAERLISRHEDRDGAEQAKWTLLGMGRYAPGEKLTARKRPEAA